MGENPSQPRGRTGGCRCAFHPPLSTGRPVTQPLTRFSAPHPAGNTYTHRAVVRPGARDVSAEINLASDSPGTEGLLRVLLWHCPGESRPSPGLPLAHLPSAGVTSCWGVGGA